MSKMKNWMMEMHESTSDALNEGIGNVDEVIAYVRYNIDVVDEDYIKKLYVEFMGE